MTIRCTIHHTMAKKSQIKQKRTFSLSPESLEYLENIRKQKKAPSTSTVLDEIIREKRHASELARAEASIVSYYDSISDDERSELSAWGHFGTSQFPEER
jgi:hypothetical protein